LRIFRLPGFAVCITLALAAVGCGRVSNTTTTTARKPTPEGNSAASGSTQPGTPTGPVDLTGKPAKSFTLQDADGKSVTLAEYKGKVVLLNFWATWCGPCKIEIPWFADFERRYKDRGFAVLGVAMDDDGWSVVKPYLEKNKINYRIAVGNDDLAKSYGGVESLPTTFIIDRDGTVTAMHQGLVSKDDYEKEIVSNLDKRAGRTDSSGSGVVLASAVPERAQ